MFVLELPQSSYYIYDTTQFNIWSNNRFFFYQGRTYNTYIHTNAIKLKNSAQTVNNNKNHVISYKVNL